MLVSIVAATFLLMCNVFAVLVYPLWAKKRPDKAREYCCISAILHSSLLEQLADPLKVSNPTSKVLVKMQNILLPVSDYQWQRDIGLLKMMI